MSFLTWAALAVACLVAAPVLAHMLRRRPPDERAFAGTAFVPRQVSEAQRRAAIQDRPLFAVRAAAILGLALLGATPFIQCNRLAVQREGGASVAMAIVLDDSLSMRVPLADGTLTRFERGQEAAGELLHSLRSGDVVAVVLAGKPVRVVLGATADIALAKNVLAGLRQSDRGTDLVEALRLSAELLKDLPHADRRIAVLSDLADANLSEESVPSIKGVRLWAPLLELRGDASDCALVSADRRATKVAVRVLCHRGGEALAGTTSGKPSRHIEVRSGSEMLVRTPFKATSGETNWTLTLPTDGKQSSVEELHAVLTGQDRIAANDRAPVMVLGGGLRLGLVSDPSRTRVATGGLPPVEQAIKSLRMGIDLALLTSVPDQKEALDALDVLLVDDVAGFTPGQRHLLGEWLQGGGVMLLFLGPGSAAAPLGSGFAPMVPAIVRWRTTSARGIDVEADELFGETAAGLSDISPRGRAELDIESSTDLRTVSVWQDGRAFAVQNQLGRGLVIALTVPLATTQSDFALRPAILALLTRTVERARSLGGVARTTVGYPWRFDGFAEVQVRRVGASRTESAVEMHRAGEQVRVVPALAGNYWITLAGERVQRVAAVDPDEVDLSPRPLATDETIRSSEASRNRIDVSAYVAMALLGLLLLELVLRLWGGGWRMRLATIKPR